MDRFCKDVDCEKIEHWHALIMCSSSRARSPSLRNRFRDASEVRVVCVSSSVFAAEDFNLYLWPGIGKMSKRKFGFEGFGINKKPNYEFEAQPAKPRLYLPSPPRNRRSDDVEDHDLDNIGYEDDERYSEKLMDRVQSKDSGSSESVRGLSSKSLKEKGKRDESWFGSDDDDDIKNAGGSAAVEDDEVDPLDAFMEGIHEEVCVISYHACVRCEVYFTLASVGSYIARCYNQPSL